ncbi:hypothetical protein OAH36_04610 [Verrucomicrobia bacterium]|jgi:hypothetical protein|nr:hypothetical protein [Verrucomicrobiota bacterium]
MPQTVVETCDDRDSPYRVCKACHDRLMARALRPVEWYNLAKSHSWSQYLLHDDFYDEDGTASQPETDVVDAVSHPAPRLSNVAGDPERLLDYSITRWHLDDDTKGAWQIISPEAVLPAISTRFTSTGNQNIRSACLEVASLTQGEGGADFVRYCWGEYPFVDLISLSQASAACLPFREGFDRVCDALAEFEGSQKRDLMFALSYFRSTEALDWIERTVFEPITESWGYLAAASDLDWQRIEAWFGTGRPLSLVAIDALRSIVRPMTLFLREHSPTLRDRPTPEIFSTVLTEYMKRDPVPRVEQRIKGLLEHGTSLTNSG